MKRELALRRQVQSLGTLRQAVDAMRSLSAHHLRASRTGLASARAYRAGIDRAMASAGVAQAGGRAGQSAILLVAADLGLCNGYNVRLAEAALQRRGDLGPAPFYCVGRRPLGVLRRANVTPTRTYPAITSVVGLTTLLLRLADDVLGDYASEAFGTLLVVSARFDGIGAFTPVVTRVLPVGAPETAAPPVGTPYSNPDRLASIAVREYLYSTLYALLLDALASEHGERLVATQSAGQWLDARVEALRRELTSVRREATTQEVLEVAAGARQRRGSGL